VKKIYLDPGHGGKDPGAMGNSVIEKELNLQVADKIKQVLKGNDFIVHMSREDDSYLNLSNRALEANKLDYDVFISVHHNSAHNTKAEGFESIYYPRSCEGKQISDLILANVEKYTCRIQRKSRPDVRNLAVLRKTKMAAVVVECGFISNPFEAHILTQQSHQWMIAVGIAQGLIEWRDGQ